MAVNKVKEHRVMPTWGQTAEGARNVDSDKGS